MSTNKFEREGAEEWLTQAQAARLRGVSRQAIAKLISRGRLRTLTLAGITLVHKADIENFEARRAGRPRKHVTE